MTTPQTTARTTLAEIEAEVTARVPGWQAWATRTHDRRTLWSARPDGAPCAVITDEVSGDDLVKAVRKYERELDSHLDDARRRLALVPHSGIGRDSAAQLAPLIAALEALQAKLGDQAAY